MLEDQDQ
jgi:serine/threonine protein phosphatase PrpC